MRSQDIQSLPQRIHLLLVVRNSNGVDNAAHVPVGDFGLEIASLAAGRGASRRRHRSQGLGARQRSRGTAALTREAELAESLGAHLPEALGEVDDGPAGAQREAEDEEVDAEAVIGEDDGPFPSSSHCRGLRVEFDVLVVLVLVGMLRRDGFLGDDPVAQGQQGYHGEPARAAGRPGEDRHDGGKMELLT